MATLFLTHWLVFGSFSGSQPDTGRGETIGDLKIPQGISEIPCGNPKIPQGILEIPQGILEIP